MIYAVEDILPSKESANRKYKQLCYVVVNVIIMAFFYALIMHQSDPENEMFNVACYLFLHSILLLTIGLFRSDVMISAWFVLVIGYATFVHIFPYAGSF